MAKRAKKRASLEEVLASFSQEMFPEQDGEAPVTLESVSASGDSPLHIAVEKGNLYAVQMLLDEGCDINAAGHRGETPLHKAVGEFDVEMTKFLLGAGADRRILSDAGETAQQFSAYYAPELSKLFR